MALVVLASEGLDAILSAGSSLGDNAVIVVMTKRGNLLGLSLGAAIVQALVGLHAGSLTGGGRGDSTIIPLVTHSRDDLSLGRAVTRQVKVFSPSSVQVAALVTTPSPQSWSRASTKSRFSVSVASWSQM